MHPTDTRNNGGDNGWKNDGNNGNGKPKRRTRFLRCFRNADMERSAVQSVGGGKDAGVGKDPVIKYVKVTQKDGVVFTDKIFNSLPLRDEEFIAPKKDKSRRSFKRVMKAVLFETSLAKKIKKNKKQKPPQATGNLSADLDKKDSNPIKKHSSCSICNQDLGDRRIIADATSSSSLWSPSCVSSSSSSRSSATTNHSFPSNLTDSMLKEDAMQHYGIGYYSSNTGLCLLLISLLVLVLWGKLCSILCTSVWLFFIPRLNIRKQSPKYSPNYRGVDSVEDRKRIIIEGLLQRNHNGGQ